MKRRTQKAQDSLSSALLTRAAVAESERQAARARGDAEALAQAESELQRLWRAWASRDDSTQRS